LLEALGNIGDFVGGIGVVVTLLYLAVQIRHNTRSVRTASRQEIAAGIREWNRMLLDPVVAEAYRRGARTYPAVDPEAAARFEAVMNDLALFMQGAFALWENGALEDETYQAYLDFFATNVSTPGGAAWWTEASAIYMTRMVRNVEGRLARGNVREPIQTAPYAPRDDEAPPAVASERAGA